MLSKHLCRAVRSVGESVLAHLLRPLERHYAVEFALDNFNRAKSGLSVRDVARDDGLSQRRFIQLLFAREVGMAPKLFSRAGAFVKR